MIYITVFFLGLIVGLWIAIIYLRVSLLCKHKTVKTSGNQLPEE